MILTSIGVGGFQLDAPAAASFARQHNAGMPLTAITETHRSYAEEVSLFLARYKVQWLGSGPYGDVRWWKGKRYVRISGAGMAARPGTSVHGLGNAMDCNDPMRTWLRNHPEFGWRFTIPSEPWHCEYATYRDKHLTAVPTSNTTEDIMTPAQEAKLNAIYDALFTDKDPTSAGTHGGVLHVLKRIDDAVFLKTPTSFDTPGGVLVTLKAILDKIK